jgi:hypothetical protein
LGDTDKFVVSEVLSHEGDPKDKRNMWFIVRWAGFPEGWDTTREPCENLQNNSVLLSYLRDHELWEAIQRRHQKDYRRPKLSTTSNKRCRR